MSTKILKSIKEISEISSIAKGKHKKVGLVFGAYDVLHMGHINLFKLAKKHVDILIVGLDNDKTIKLSKGNNRPINNYYRRSNFLSEITNVDYIFKIGKVFKHGDIKSFEYFEKLYNKIQPTH
ncbi:MAG: adenylyltransferase/cytidyltransferase family protein, partial [Candidatus Woesebacteria bacterium]|nr:adenylyltransferase/cytidyltransferase family protein [Candidatus Woesebacteria bacterium]